MCMCMWGWAWTREFSVLMAWRKKLFFSLRFGQAGMESFARWQPLEEFVFARVVSAFNDLPSSGGSPAWCKCAAGWAGFFTRVLIGHHRCELRGTSTFVLSPPGFRRSWEGCYGSSVCLSWSPWPSPRSWRRSDPGCFTNTMTVIPPLPDNPPPAIRDLAYQHRIFHQRNNDVGGMRAGRAEDWGTPMLGWRCAVQSSPPVVCPSESSGCRSRVRSAAPRPLSTAL